MPVGCGQRMRVRARMARLTTHMDSISKEVGSISDQDDQAALNLWLPSDVGELEQQARRQSDQKPDDERTEENEQEDSDRLEQTQNRQLAGRCTLAVFLRRLKQNDRNSVVQDGFAEDDGVQFGVDLVSVEDGQNCHRIRRREGRTNRHGLHKGYLQTLEWDIGPCVEDDPEHDGRDEGAGECERQDGAYIAEEVALPMLVNSLRLTHCLSTIRLPDVTHIRSPE